MTIEVFDEENLKQRLLQAKDTFETLRSKYWNKKIDWRECKKDLDIFQTHFYLTEKDLRDAHSDIHKIYKPFFKRIRREMRGLHNSIYKIRDETEDHEEIDIEKETELVGRACDLSAGTWQYKDFDDAYRDYTDAEVKKFPFEIRCCHYIAPFNKKLNPKTIEEWAEAVGFFGFDTDGCFHKCAVKCAIESVNGLIEFVKEEKG